MPALSTLDKGNCRCILQLRNSSRNILHIYLRIFIHFKKYRGPWVCKDEDTQNSIWPYGHPQSHGSRHGTSLSMFPKRSLPATGFLPSSCLYWEIRMYPDFALHGLSSNASSLRAAKCVRGLERFLFLRQIRKASTPHIATPVHLPDVSFWRGTRCGALLSPPLISTLGASCR